MIELHRDVRGQGPPLLILHGLFGSLANWRSVAKSLADRFTVYSLDLRNHGASPWDPVHTYSAMTCDVVGVMDEAGIEKACVLGHSMGGKVAMNLALTYPGRVGRLVVVDIAPGAYRAEGELLSILQAMRDVDAASLGDRAEADSILARSISNPDVRAFLLMNLRRNENADGFRWRVNLDALADNWASLAVGITSTKPWAGPALFVRGELSDYVRRDHESQIEALFPAARVETVRGAGHWVHAERPREFLAIVQTFLGPACRNTGQECTVEVE